MGRLTTKNFRPTRSVKQIKENMLLEMYDKLAHYEDLEEQGRLIEQKHGQWIANKHMVKSPTAENYHCSECTQAGKRTSYCPNCGAKMDEVE